MHYATHQLAYKTHLYFCVQANGIGYIPLHFINNISCRVNLYTFALPKLQSRSYRAASTQHVTLHMYHEVQPTQTSNTCLLHLILVCNTTFRCCFAHIFIQYRNIVSISRYACLILLMKVLLMNLVNFFHHQIMTRSPIIYI